MRFADEELDDEPCECGAADCKVARAIFDKAIEKLPNDVELFCLSQGDQLMDEQVRDIFQGDYNGVEEHIADWFRDNDHWAIDYEIEQILDSDEIEVLRAHPSNEMPDHWTLHDQLADAIRDHDESDPMGELIRATPDVMLRLDARLTVDGSELPEDSVATLCRELGLSPLLNRERILQWLAENHDEVWGDVSIIWRADVKEAVDQFSPWDDEEHGNVAVFTDPWIEVEGCSLLELRGEAVVRLTKVNLLPSVDNETCHDQKFAASPEVMSEFDHYRQGVLAFYEYRAGILERA